MKRLRLFAVLLLIFCLTGCVKEEKTDYSEIERRLIAVDKQFAFSYETLFFTDSAFYITYSLTNPQDAMLILETDTLRTVTGLKLCAQKQALTEEFIEKYTFFCSALTKAFAPNDISQALYDVSGVASLNGDYAIGTYSQTVRRYRVTFFTDTIGVCYAINRI